MTYVNFYQNVPQVVRHGFCTFTFLRSESPEINVSNLVYEIVNNYYK